MREPCVYILASGFNGTLYTGVTSNLVQRLHQHRSGDVSGFTSTKGIKRLMWFEMHETMETAIQREKSIKRWKREYKMNLIERDNSRWDDLAIGLGFDALDDRSR
ncbi:Endonuclease [Sphingomonas sp. AX6]|nr:Endonuclease [Sphingomonas sp. AX6]